MTGVDEAITKVTRLEKVGELTLQTTSKLDKSTGKWHQSMSAVDNRLPRFKMHLLSTMFAGMALQKSMDGLTQGAFEMLGVNEYLAAAVDELVLTALDPWADALFGLGDAILGADADTKFWVGSIILFLGTAAGVVTVLSQIGLAVMGFQMLNLGSYFVSLAGYALLTIPGFISLAFWLQSNLGLLTKFAAGAILAAHGLYTLFTTEASGDFWSDLLNVEIAVLEVAVLAGLMYGPPGFLAVLAAGTIANVGASILMSIFRGGGGTVTSGAGLGAATGLPMAGETFSRMTGLKSPLQRAGELAGMAAGSAIGGYSPNITINAPVAGQGAAYRIASDINRALSNEYLRYNTTG